MTFFYLPDLGEGLAEAVIHEWHTRVGDELKIDKPMVSVETAKAIVEIPAPCNGRVQKLLANIGETIKTGEPLIEIESETELATVAGKLETSDIILPPEISAKPADPQQSIKALPAARALAKKLNLDLTVITGTGPQGQITLEDIEKVSATAVSWQSHATPISGVRLSMAQNMQRAHQSVVAASIFDEATIAHWPVNSDITARLIQALCAACQAEPALNAWYDGNKQVRLLQPTVNIGLAMDTADGLFVPVIKQAEQKSLTELREVIEHYKQALSKKKLPPEAFQGATISLSNIGKFAGKFATPVVIPPTVAILAAGRIDTKSQLLPLSLSFDHRVVTGGEASRFLAIILKVIASDRISK